MKKFIAILLVLTMMLGLTACGECDHDWEKATCEDPKTCSKCGETKGDPEEDHDWEEDDGKMVCSWCGEEKDASDDVPSDEDEDEHGSLQTPDAPHTPGGISWYCTAKNGLTHYVPEGMQVAADNPNLIVYQNESMMIHVANGYLGSDASSAQEFAQVYMEDSSSNCQSIEMGSANGTPYVLITHNDGTYTLTGFYYYNEYGWLISVSFSDWDSYGDIAIRCVTTGQLDETIAAEYIAQAENADATETDDTETVDIETDDADDYFTVHAYVPLAWGYPSCWAWSSVTGENVFDEWPGEVMYWTGDHYIIEIPTWADYVIVNGVDGAVQTLDEPVEPGCDIWIVVYPDGGTYGVSYTEPTAEEFAEAGY